MATAIILGAPRYRLGSLSTGTGGTVATMPIGNLQTDEPSELWRHTNLDPAESWLFWTNSSYGAGLQTSFDVNAMSLINHNLSRDAKVRFVLSDFNIDEPISLAPTSLESSTNFTGGFADVDDNPFAPDGNNMTTSTPGVASQARFGFDTPADPPTTGADNQAFVALVTGSGSGSGLVDLELYEAGGLVATLVNDQTVVAGADSLLVGYWNASSLGTSSGADVELRINNHTPGASFGLTIKAVRWIEDPSDVASLSYDSGWLDAVSDPVDTLWGDTAPSTAGRAPVQNFVHVLPSTIDAERGFFYIRDPENSDGYLQAGVLVVGPCFQPTLNRAYGPLVNVEDLSVKKKTHGGQTFGVSRPRLRKVYFPHAALSAAEAHSLFDRLYWRRGILRPVLVSLFPGDATEGGNTTVWATPEQFEDLGAPDPSGYRTLGITFLEKL